MPAAAKPVRVYRRGKQKTEKIFSVRLRRETRAGLEKLAAHSGRTLGGEIEAAIELASVAANRSPTFGIMLLISDTIDGLVALHPGSGAKAFKGKPGGWLHNAYLHEQAKQVSQHGVRFVPAAAGRLAAGSEQPGSAAGDVICRRAANRAANNEDQRFTEK